MEGDNTKPSTCRHGCDSPRHFATQLPQSPWHFARPDPESPCLVTNTHTYQPTVPHFSHGLCGNSSGLFDKTYASLDDYSFFSAANVSTFSVPMQVAARFDPVVVDGSLRIFPDAEQQNFTAQGASLSQLLDPPQTPNTVLTLFNMNNINQEHEGPAQPTEPILPDGIVSLTCTFPECPEQQPFPTKSALRRHQDKHFRPYICTHPSCNHQNFGNKGGLDRHTREVHGSQSYTCPVLSCKRHKRAFHRRYNLVEHQRRAHGIRPPTHPKAPSERSEELSESEDSTPRPQHESNGESADGGDDVAIVEMSVDGALSSEDIRMKLRDLRNSRVKLDKAIRTMERALRIMDGASL
ncbi:hypothetical protein BP6252_10924 [Coleophoma cylindrospora]|uniref:C2H2-type domain-containing protein n=1 Tax=Coleophoma cylindrospora TaxID=1849047 RepID=A0A3D8QNM2_9HELO|nr:hypothetical protein BP6252_10924 [Coleophoma cylindrospora]